MRAFCWCWLIHWLGNFAKERMNTSNFGCNMLSRLLLCRTALLPVPLNYNNVSLFACLCAPTQSLMLASFQAHTAPQQHRMASARAPAGTLSMRPKASPLAPMIPSAAERVGVGAVCVCACMFVCVCVCACVCVCSVCMRVYVYVLLCMCPGLHR